MTALLQAAITSQRRQRRQVGRPKMPESSASKGPDELDEPGGPDDMPQQPSQADRFSRARQARSATLLEDYAELIADLMASGGEARTVDIARRLGVAHATAIKAIGRLKREGLVTARPYRGVFLTAAGQAMAERVRARHRVVVRLLVALGVPLEDAEADAEGIEHHVSDGTLAAFDRFLCSGR